MDWRPNVLIWGLLSQSPPALASHQGALHIVHRGDDSHSLWHPAFTRNDRQVRDPWRTLDELVVTVVQQRGWPQFMPWGEGSDSDQAGKGKPRPVLPMTNVLM